MPREIPMKFLPPREAARLLGMSIIALHRAIAFGDVRVKKFGDTVLVPVADINRYLETPTEEEC
jgi:hypothetical protein